MLLAPEDELELGEAELEPLVLDLSLVELGEVLLLDELGELMLPEALLLPGVEAEPDMELDEDGEVLGEVLEPEDDEGLDGLVDEEEAPVDDLPAGAPVRSQP